MTLFYKHFHTVLQIFENHTLKTYLSNSYQINRIEKNDKLKKKSSAFLLSRKGIFANVRSNRDLILKEVQQKQYNDKPIEAKNFM